MRYSKPKFNSHLSRTFVLLMVFAACAFAQTAVPRTVYDAAYYNGVIKKMTDAADNASRGEVIKNELAAIGGIRISTNGFVTKNRRGDDIKGNNIIAEVSNPKAKKTVMVGAHLDRVSVGKGSLDNASGVAAVLMLLKQFKEKPMAGIKFQAAFWDQEEQGLVGSRMYVEARKNEGLPDVYINFDIYGYGDTFWLWARDKNSVFAGYMEKASKSSPYTLSVTTDYPASDHRSFAAVEQVDTYSFSLLTKTEIDAFARIFAGERIEPSQSPKVMQTIHTDKDQEDVIDAKAVTASLPVIEQAIREFDKK